MPAASIIISSDELGDEDILELNSANFSLRVALIFLIVTVIIFAVMQLIKLICQIWTISSKAAEIDLPFDSETPEITVHSKERKRESRKKSKRRKSKYSLPSKEMKIQLSLPKGEEREIISDSEIITKKKPQNEIQNTAEISVVSHGEIQKFSGKLSIPDIKDSLAFFGNKSLLPIASTKLNIDRTYLQSQSPAMPISTGEKPILPKIEAQDSLMVIDNQMSLQPIKNVEQRNSAPQVKEQEPTFLAAKLQDSLMVVNSQIPLQPAGSVEQSNLGMATKSEEVKTVQQKKLES